MAKAKVRISLDVTPEMAEVIEKMAEQAKLSKADLLRNGLGLMKVVLDGREKGRRVQLSATDEEGPSEIILSDLP